MRSQYCGLIDDSVLGQEATVCGWVNRRRDHGGVIFIDLRDREGILQVVFDPDDPTMFSQAETLRNEFIIQVKGLVRNRPEGTINPSLKSGIIRGNQLSNQQNFVHGLLNLMITPTLHQICSKSRL